MSSAGRLTFLSFPGLKWNTGRPRSHGEETIPVIGLVPIGFLLLLVRHLLLLAWHLLLINSFLLLLVRHLLLEAMHFFLVANIVYAQHQRVPPKLNGWDEMRQTFASV